MILNKKEDYEYFMKRSQSWKNVFDWNTGFMRPKKNGGWDKPFDPREINNNFTEGNSWQYSFFVPQDIPEMINAYGGNEKFEAKLDEMFNAESKTTGREQVDVSGLIGQYAHGNEPSHHMAYLYNYVGKPEKTTEKVHYILDNFYKNAPDGLIGNEDCGQMSAWFVLSSIGIYSVTPGKAEWIETEPLFEKIKVNFEVGKSELLNENSNKSRLGIINTKYNFIKPKLTENIIPVPVIQAESKSFNDKMKIEIISNSNEPIYYRTSFEHDIQRYLSPIEIDKSCTVYAKTIRNHSERSKEISAQFFKKPNSYTIDIKSTCNPQYHAGGSDGLLDGIFGTTNWRKGDWQGYHGQDFEAIVDLQEPKSISEIHSNYLQDQRSWIVMPTKVEYYTSMDNINFTLVTTISNDVNPKQEENSIKDFSYTTKPINARYVKVKAYNFGKLPEWHQGFGGDAFIFIDEITIK